MLDGLVGKWKVIGCQLNGVWLPYSIFQEFRYSFFKDDTFRLDWAELSFPLYVGGFPKSKSGKVLFGKVQKNEEIDLVPDEGPFAGKPLQGIFELDHDLLKAIFSFPGTERPKVFNTTQGQVYEIWQRIE
jgi:uncharacterized protein (TIGR03067 family)